VLRWAFGRQTKKVEELNMFLSIGVLAVASGTLYTGVNAIKQRQKKKKTPWTFYAETHGITKMGTFGAIGVNEQLKRRSKIKSGGEVLERVFAEQLPTFTASATSLVRSGVSAIGDLTEETLAPVKSRVSAIGDLTEEKLALLFSNE